MADTRSASEVAFHRREIARMTLKEGKTQAEIAEALGISQPTVSRDLSAIRSRWTKEAKQELDVWRGRLIEELTLVKGDAWASWAKSLQPKADKPDEVRTGNIAYLREVGETLMKIHKVLGFDKLEDATDDKQLAIQINVSPVPARPRPDGNPQPT